MATPETAEGEGFQPVMGIYESWLRGELASEDALFMLGDVLALREAKLTAEPAGTAT